MGGRPSLFSRASIFAPAFKSRTPISCAPFCAAWCSGIMRALSVVRAFGFAPAFSSCRTIFVMPGMTWFCAA